MDRLNETFEKKSHELKKMKGSCSFILTLTLELVLLSDNSAETHV